MKHRRRGKHGRIRCRCLLAASLFVKSECASPTSSSISAFASSRQRGSSNNNNFYNSYYETHVQNIQQRSPREHRLYTLRRTIQRLSVSSDFPSQDLSEDDYDSNNGIQFQRHNYDQGKIGSIPTDRLAMIHSSTNSNNEEEDDEWDSYLDMNVDSDGNYVQNNGIDVNYNDRDNGIGKNSMSTRVEQAQVNDVQQIEPYAGQSQGNGGYENRKVHIHKDKDDSIEITNEEQQPRTNEHTRVDESVDDFRNQFGDRQSKTFTANIENEDVSLPNNDEPRQRDTQSQKQRITKEQIQEIKSSISLVDAIETYNLPEFTRTSSSLYTSSAAAKACCPFHNDNNPSMSIDDGRGLYKCFACGAGGDIFNFIREYDYLDSVNNKSGGKKEKMGYMAAVEYAVREFGNGEYDSDNWNFGGSKGMGRFENMSEDTREKIRAREKKKDRICQANTAAAAFYTRCLVTLPTAGKARAHLRTRNISPESIRTFAIGYAPDCYYGDEKPRASNSKQGNRSWGNGSLVEYLAQAGFAPDEIVEAGLAVRTKQKQQQQQQQQQVKDKDHVKEDKSKGNQSDKEGSDVDQDKQHDYSGLMDRFRSRLIVPIMDEVGQNVIALGGRHLETSSDNDGENDKNEKFTPAKYINSPDSLVFTKKNVMFNRHKANVALNELSSIDESSSSTPEGSFDAPPAVVIVEGYFDAIALSNVGVKNAVASMGTALPLEQLKIAAEMGDIPGGRIILCMDGDDAGINAVERLCSSNILSKVPELNRNELYVATLPVDDNVKDPSDFVDFAGGGEKAQQRFQEEILDKAILWDEWYISRILSKHKVDAKDGTEGSFADVCDKVSTFLSTFTSPADRTRRVHKIAERLVDMITEDDAEKSSSSLSMLRVQFESDILNMSSRKAGVREAMERRIEQTDGLEGDATTSKMERLTRGEIDMNDDDRRMGSKNALARTMPQPGRAEQRSQRPTAKPRTRTFRATRKPNRARLPERHLVPHFNGFQFKHQSDRDWLGLSGSGKSKPKMYLGETPAGVEEKDRLRAETPIFEESYKPSRKKEDAVYFNSNRYLGEQYLTPDAIRAGYSLGGDRPAPGESIVEFMDNRLFENDPDQLILQAEDRLLHALSKFPQARATMMTVYSTSTFGPANMRWTSKEREWLFLCLTGSPEMDPPLTTELLDGGTPSQLHLHLANRGDCPENSFNVDVVESVATATIRDTVEPEMIDYMATESSLESLDDNFSISRDESSDNSNDKPMVEVVTSEEDSVDSFREDAETGGDTTAKNSHITYGILDEYFLETDIFPSLTNSKIAKETRAELTVQETVATILRATAMKRFALAKLKLTQVVSEMDRRDNNDEDGSQLAIDNEFDGVSSDELQELFQKMGNEVLDAQKSLYEAERSTDRVNSHLLDYSTTNGVKYKLSQAELERLDKMMDDFLDSLPEDTHRPSTPPGDNYVFGDDEQDANIDPMFGGRDPDDYVVRGLPNGESKWD